jgi:hypothetical protein
VLFEPDVLLPSQYGGGIPAHQQTGEMRLAYAVLEDALHILRVRAHAVSPWAQEQREEVLAWIASNDEHYPHSYRNCCHWIGLDPDLVRGKLRALGWIPHKVRKKERLHRPVLSLRGAGIRHRFPSDSRTSHKRKPG